MVATAHAGRIYKQCSLTDSSGSMSFVSDGVYTHLFNSIGVVLFYVCSMAQAMRHDHTWSPGAMIETNVAFVCVNIYKEIEDRCLPPYSSNPSPPVLLASLRVPNPPPSRTRQLIRPQLSSPKVCIAPALQHICHPTIQRLGPLPSPLHGLFLRSHQRRPPSPCPPPATPHHRRLGRRGSVHRLRKVRRPPRLVRLVSAKVFK